MCSFSHVSEKLSRRLSGILRKLGIESFLVSSQNYSTSVQDIDEARRIVFVYKLRHHKILVQRRKGR